MLTTYTTTSITWADGIWETSAHSPAEAAICHAEEGWDSEDDPRREPITIVVAAPDGTETRWEVSWEDGKAVARELASGKPDAFALAQRLRNRAARVVGKIGGLDVVDYAAILAGDKQPPAGDGLWLLEVRGDEHIWRRLTDAEAIAFAAGTLPWEVQP